MRARRIQQARTSTQTIIMDGGYNENISSLEMKGGELQQGINYYLLEGSSGGYQSTKGYERYDGTALSSTIAEDLREAHRATIGAVPGAGRILGLHIFKDVLYAFRNSTNSTDTQMWKATGSGWSQIDLGSKITFDTGAVAALQVGETLTGGTSTATGTLLKVVITSGTVAGGDAVGYIILEVLTGTFQSGEAITGGTSTGAINTTSVAVAQTITKDGTYHFINYNFYATSDYEEMYFTNSVNKAMIWDGTALDFIDNSGMDPSDTPINITAHNDRLWLAYEGGSAQYSTAGDPTDWTTDAGEQGVGDEIKDFLSAVGNALIVFLDNSIKVLQGTADTDTWQWDSFSRETGGYEFTPKRMFGKMMFMNARGVTTLDAVQDFGDFKASTISEKVYNTLQKYKTLTTSAVVNRELNQYRVFFSNGYGVVFSFIGPKFRGATLLKYPEAVNVTCEGKDSNDNTVVYFGGTSADGYVYKMDSGTSFDGAVIDSRLFTAYYHYGSPTSWKRFLHSTLEVACISDITLSYKFYFDYSESSLPKAQDRTEGLGAAVDTWGSEAWGTMVWSSGSPTNRMKVFVHGIGANVGIAISHSSAVDFPHTVQNMTTVFEKLREQI